MWRHNSRGVLWHSITFSIKVFNHIFNSILIYILVQLRLDFNLHFILTWFDNTSGNRKMINWQKGHDGCRSWTCQLKERIFISNIDMNPQHKSFYKFVWVRGEPKQVWSPKFHAGGEHGPLGASTDPPNYQLKFFTKICVNLTQ